MIPSAGRLGAAAALLTLVVFAPPAGASRATGARATVEIAYSTEHAGSPAGFAYSAEFRDPDNPDGTPPPLRKLTITAPAGALVDTSVPARCEASDEDLKRDGASACPEDSVIGTGYALTKPDVFPRLSYDSLIFNAADQQVQLLTSDPPAPTTVVRGFFRGSDFESTIPTCFNGGAPPDGCSTDQASLIRNELTIPPFTTGEGRSRRSYFTTPMFCPRSRVWESVVTFLFGDGVEERLTTTQPCTPARTRVVLRPRRVRAGERTRVRLRAFALLGGISEPLSEARVRLAGRRATTDGSGRAALTVRFARPGPRRVRLRRAGMSPSSAKLRVRPKD